MTLARMSLTVRVIDCKKTGVVGCPAVTAEVSRPLEATPKISCEPDCL
jgi:hypothetical protein